MTQVISTTVNTNDVGATVTPDNPLIVTRQGVLNALGHGIVGAGMAKVSIYGSVISDQIGATLDGNANILTLGHDAVLSGRRYGAIIGLNGIGNNQIFNDGEISSSMSTSLAIYGSNNTFINGGVISTLRFEAILLSANNGSGNKIFNTGTIIGGYANADGTGSHVALRGLSGNEYIQNQGTISGDVLLDAGDDIYDGRGGEIVGLIDLGIGNDTAYGGAGSEIFAGGGGNDIIDGGDGIDTYIVSMDEDRSVRVDLGISSKQSVGLEPVYGLGLDTLLNIENVTSFGGNDRLIGNSGANILSAGNGDDTLEGGAGDDTLIGGDGIDTVVFSGSANARIDLRGQENPLSRDTGYGHDMFVGIENVIAGDGNDDLWGDEANNLLIGGRGNDLLAGERGNDTLEGGAGTNTAYFFGASDLTAYRNNGDGTWTATGNNGTDLLRDIRFLRFNDKTVALWNSAPTSLGLSSTSVSEAALAGTLIASLSARDADGDSLSYSLAAGSPFRIDGTSLVLTGPLDFETKASHSLTVVARDAYGGEVSQSFKLQVTDAVEVTPFTLTGTAGADRLEGEAGNDVLTGLSGADVLLGEVGNDVLAGGAGKDVLTGGAGQDVFVFDSRPNKTANVDRIEDFKVADDTLHLAKSVFTKMAKKGVIKSAEFYQGPKAHDRDDRLIYDKKTGALYYDADGTGAQAQIQIAALSKNLKMTYKDFFVI